jgi:hypothetical protein
VRHRHFRSQLTQNARGRFVAGAIGNIDGDPHFFERHPAGETRFRKLDVTPEGVVDPGGAPDLLRRRSDGIDLAGENKLLDFAFTSSSSL